MMTDKICPKCGGSETMMLADKLGKLFEKENLPSLPPGDSLTAGISYDGPNPILTPFLCDNSGCGIWFAIFCLPEETK